MLLSRSALAKKSVCGCSLCLCVSFGACLFLALLDTRLRGASQSSAGASLLRVADRQPPSSSRTTNLDGVLPATSKQESTELETPKKEQAHSSIPLVYVFFHAEAIRDEAGSVRWNATTAPPLPESFYFTLAASLLHVPEVVVIADPAVREIFEQSYPRQAVSKLRVFDYLQYADDEYFRFKELYESRLRPRASRSCCQGSKEPWEKLNFLNFVILRAWMKQEGVSQAGYAEADVAVIVPPWLPEGCDSEILWRYRYNTGKKLPWKPFCWDALASAGNVLSAEVLDDFIEFMLKVYGDEEKLSLLTLRADSYMSHVVNQMYLWFLYAMASLDAKGEPWSDGKPWLLQYAREPPRYWRQGLRQPSTGRLTVPESLWLPETRRLKLCNGYYPRAGMVFDNSQAFAFAENSNGAVGEFSISISNASQGTIKARQGHVRLQNLHFQGNSKGTARILLQKFIPWPANTALFKTGFALKQTSS